MEVDEQLHAVGCCAPSDLHSRVDVVVAAAVAAAGAVIGVVPDAHADHIDAVFGKDRKEILFRTVEVIVSHAAALFGQYAGNIHAENKILRQVFHFFDIQRFRAHGVFLLLRGGSGASAGGKQQCRGKQQRCESAFFCLFHFSSPVSQLIVSSARATASAASSPVPVSAAA